MYDYIVIGAGSAGCVLAGRLSEDPLVKVCLLEAGGEDRSVLIHCPAGLALMAQGGRFNWNLSTTAQAGLNGRHGYQPRGKVLGGSSSINAMIYTRGQPADYDHWAALGNVGWAWRDVLPYFLRAEHNERGASAWHGTGGPLNVMDLRSPNPVNAAFIAAAQQAGYLHNPDFNGAEQEGAGQYQVTHKNGERCSAAKAYLTPHLARPNLTVITGAHATRILMEERRAMGVEYWKNDEQHTIRAVREVLLCAGSLLSPQLLMPSGIGDGEQLQQHGINTVHHLPGVGAQLHDHIDVVQVMDTPRHTELLGLSLAGLGHIVRGIFEWRRQRSGMLTTNFAESGGFIKSSASEATPDLQLHFVVGKLIDHGRQSTLGHGYSCHVCLLQPQSRGSVKLASNRPLDMPLVDPAFLSDPADLPRLLAGFKLMRKILAQPALAQLGGRALQGAAALNNDALLEAFIRQQADTIYHPVGSCRMGYGAMDVVDAELRVHGIQGLRVVDASIMPRIVSGNTNAPTIMIAEKAADLIRLDNP